MSFTGLSWWAVLIGVGFSFVSGGIWFGPKTFYPLWLKAKGVSEPSRENSPSPIYLFGSTLVAQFVQVLTVGLIVNSIQLHQPNVGIVDGAGIGLALGLGISAFSSLPHRLFSMENYKSWAIECGSDILNYILVAALFAYMNQ